MQFILNPLSANIKTGIGVAVSTSSSDTCPKSCPLKDKECYARFGPLNIHWKRLNEAKTGTDWEDFVKNVYKLPIGYSLRHNQAGDLPNKGMNNNSIDRIKLNMLSDAIKNRKLRSWTYTHKPLTKSNVSIIKEAISKGFVVNASTDSMKAADKSRKLGLPTVVTVTSDTKNGTITPDGNKIIICPAQTNKGVTCASCMLCHKGNRSVIVGFHAHGTAKKSLDKKLMLAD